MVLIPLPVISDGWRGPELDIVSIPGLPTLHPHYKLKDHHKWLAEVLSHQVLQARIMAYQYDFAKDPSSTSWTDLTNRAEPFLYNLVNRREEAPQRPIIFICYSFGSIILKKALYLAKTVKEFRPIFDSTRGVIFIGCVHDETYPQFEDVCLKCAAVEFGPKKRHDAIEALKKSKDEDWNAIKDVVEKFRLLRCRFQVRTLYEEKMTCCPPEKYSWRKGKDEWLCPDSVSSMGWESEERIGVGKDHTQLTVYPSRGDSDGFFEKFCKIVTDLVKDVCPPPSIAEGRAHLQDSHEWNVVGHTIPTGDAESGFWLPESRSSKSFTSALPQVPDIALPCYVMTPFEINPDFEGREAKLLEIHRALGPAKLSENKTFVIAGMGGMGKTQLALSYAFKYRKEFQLIVCADADGKTKLSDSFIEFAKEMGLGDGLTGIKAKQLVKDCLKTLETPWLIIFDNADGDDKDQLLLEFCPEAGLHGSVLITTRDVTMLNQARYSGVELNELSEKESVDLLLKITSRHRARGLDTSAEEELKDARKITRNLGYLPLGIVQAASLILHNSCSLSEFLDAYNHRNIIKDFQDLHLQPSCGSYKYSLSTVWNMNFDRLGEDERSLINLMSYLDPDKIQMSLLKEGSAGAKSAHFAFIATHHRLIQCRAGLLRSTLISQSRSTKEVRMHRLMQASCQLRMSHEEQRLHFSRAVDLLIAVWPVPERISVHDPAFWVKQRMLLPHVQSVCKAYMASCIDKQPLIDENVVSWEFAKLLYEAGWFCYESGLLEDVYDILKPAENYCLSNLSKGGGYRILADIYGGLGSVWTESNQFEKVMDAFSKQWKYIQLAFDHGELAKPSIWEVFGLGRLGNAYHGLHRYHEAEEYYRKCLDTWKGLPGDQKIFTTHLATCLWLQGRLDEAEAVVRPIIKDWNDDTNFRTAMAIYSLGNILIAQGILLMREGKKEEAATKFAESMMAHVQTLKLWKASLGLKHHKTADAMHKVAWHYYRTRLYDKAIEQLEGALEVYEEQPKIFKNELARTKYKLGCVLQDNGDLKKGSKLVREAESIRKEIVPAENWEPATGEEDFDEIVQFWTR